MLNVRFIELAAAQAAPGFAVAAPAAAVLLERCPQQRLLFPPLHHESVRASYIPTYRCQKPERDTTLYFYLLSLNLKMDSQNTPVIPPSKEDSLEKIVAR